MQKVRFKFNQSEIRALLSLIVNCDFNAIEDHEKAELAKEVVRKLPKKLGTRSNNMPPTKKETTFTMTLPEAISLKNVIETYLDIHLDSYSYALKQKIMLEVGSKIGHLTK